ncbi:MAG: uroporphyrinogen decarboxylase family protein [Promethearchaeota archaeon]
MTLNHEEPDRVPWFENSMDSPYVARDFNAKLPIQNLHSFLNAIRIIPFWRSIAKFLVNNPNIIAAGYKSIIKLYKKVGIDLVALPVSLLLTKSVFLSTREHVDEYGRVFRLNKDPHSGIEVRDYIGGYFKNIDDYRNWGLIDPLHPLRINLSKKILQLQEKFKTVYCFPSFGGLFEPTWEAFGMPVFAKLLKKEKGKMIKEVFDERGKFCLDLAKMLVEDGHKIMLIYDDMGFKGGLFMSPRDFRKYTFPWYKKIVNAVHAKGAKIIMHSCGNITPLFEDLVNIGFDAINPIESTAGMNIFELKEKFGEKVTLVGNLSTQDLLDKNPEFIIESTNKLLKHVAPGGGYVFSSSHSIQPPVKPENFKAMRDTIIKHGVYPINID